MEGTMMATLLVILAVFGIGSIIIHFFSFMIAGFWNILQLIAEGLVWLCTIGGLVIYGLYKLISYFVRKIWHAL